LKDGLSSGKAQGKGGRTDFESSTLANEDISGRAYFDFDRSLEENLMGQSAIVFRFSSGSIYLDCCKLLERANGSQVHHLLLLFET